MLPQRKKQKKEHVAYQTPETPSSGPFTPARAVHRSGRNTATGLPTPPVTPSTRRFTPGKRADEPWHGNDALLRRLRLKDLHRKGYIDYLNRSITWPRVDNYFQAPILAHHAHLTSHQDTVPSISQNSYSFIHPVFKIGNWQRQDINSTDKGEGDFQALTEADYELLKPPLRLASSLLCEPSVLQFFAALLDRPLNTIDDEEAEKRLGYPLTTFGGIAGVDGANFNEQRLTDTFRDLILLQNCVTWKFGYAGGKAQSITWAITRGNVSRGGLPVKAPKLPPARHRTIASNVYLRPRILSTMQGKHPVTDNVKAESFDPEASTHRTWIFMAHTLIHELVHVLWKATAERNNTARSEPEPFYRDERLAELGWAFSQAVFGGGLSVLGRNTPEPACPYGLGMVRWPGAIKGARVIAKERASAIRSGETYITKGAVEMAWCHKFFTRRFWEVDVPRSISGQAVQFDWTIAIRHSDSLDLAFNEFETRVSRPKPPSPGPPAPSPTKLLAMGFRLKSGDETSEDSAEDEDAMDVDEQKLL